MTATSHHGPLRIGIGGPVGSGKTALVEALCKRMRDSYDLFVITNDIYTKEDQMILTRAGALPRDRIVDQPLRRAIGAGFLIPAFNGALT